MECSTDSDMGLTKTACKYNGVSCGYFCDWNGQNCKAVYLPQCAKEGYCPQTGYDMTDGCICEGAITPSNGKNYCCPAGHIYVNGGCNLKTCGEQFIAEGGICVDECPNFAYNGVCIDECPTGTTADENNVCQKQSD